MSVIEISGSDHEYTVRYGDTVVANVWHSDLGEWTVETPDGAVYRERGRSAADERVEKLLDAVRRS